MTRVVVIGGVAAGMSAASQAKRREPGAEVIVLERGAHVSYAAAAMPYALGPDRSMDDLVVITPERFRSERGIDVRIRHEAIAVDTARRTVTAHDLDAERRYEIPYDALVLATGARPARPDVPGLELPGVFLLRDLADGQRLKHFLGEAAPRRAVVVGAGYIGVEMADALRHHGLQVAVLERADQVLPGFAPPIAEAVRREMVRNGVIVETGISVVGIHGTRGVVTDRATFGAELVLVAVGVRPNVGLARAAGLVLGETGAIAVDPHLRTSAPGVYAAGDCVETPHLVLGKPVYVPLGTTANKQGKVAGANAVGARERFEGIVGTAAFRSFDLVVGRTGLGPAEITRAGIDAIASTSTHESRGHAYPGSRKITTVLFAERGTRRLLGAQMIGAEGIAGRIDVYATALVAGMTVDRIERLDLAYSPPLAPVYDPVLVAATVAAKALGG